MKPPRRRTPWLPTYQGVAVRQRLREARKTESGFTLIELLIVIVILGVLSAVVVIAVGAFNDRGETCLLYTSDAADEL